MSDDVVFRSKTPDAPKEAAPLPSGKEATRGSETTIEVPYLDYQAKHSHPYTVDYFKLGDTWEQPSGGFPKEINLIENYIQTKVQNGDVANSVSAITRVLKDMEKMNNLTKEERSVVKIEILANYIEFLTKNDQVKSNLKRYANTK